MTINSFGFLFSDQLASNHVLWLSGRSENTKSVLIASGCVCHLCFFDRNFGNSSFFHLVIPSL